ncbi:MAG TPA: hypothetical protein VK541_21105 [Pedobacter sp.]|uniref:hypothetical protein n=1 Tax=Pedobacter sp. TaxID=1411316 RepID=UPI002C2E3C4D|nr:hypothetical protein [Pedobacter sp.]HMI04998.1 hypothetical protein [Pedobacter sp.]
MKYLRFYYFSFLYFYKDKPESWIPEYRGLFIITMTIVSAVSFVLLMFYPNYNGIGTYVRLIMAALFITIAALMQRVLIANGKYRLIFEEFENHPMNKRSGRLACWIIWLAIFIAPLVLSVIQKGYIS